MAPSYFPFSSHLNTNSRASRDVHTFCVYLRQKKTFPFLFSLLCLLEETSLNLQLVFLTFGLSGAKQLLPNSHYTRVSDRGKMRESNLQCYRHTKYNWERKKVIRNVTHLRRNIRKLSLILLLLLQLKSANRSNFRLAESL